MMMENNKPLHMIVTVFTGGDQYTTYIAIRYIPTL